MVPSSSWARWRRLRAEIHAEVCERGYDSERNTFTQYYGSKELDASVLNIPLVGFLPAGAAVFLALLGLAMYDPWTPYRRVVFPLVGLAIVAGFYVLFSEALLVPLPTGSLFR